MKKIFLSLLFLLCNTCFCFSASTQKTDITEIRKHMLRAINSSKVTDSLYTSLQNINSTVPLVVAYLGALEALKAKDSWNPYKKIKFLNLSNKTVLRAVNASPNDLEIRFIRFSIQSNLPNFLGLNKDLTSDKNQIIQQLKQKHYGLADKAFLESIIRFMLDSKQCTPQETSFLHQQSVILK